MPAVPALPATAPPATALPATAPDRARPAVPVGPVAPVPGGQRPRLLPTPRCEPPYDEQGWTLGAQREGSGDGAVQGTLALAFTLPTGLPAVPTAPAPATPHLRVVPPPATPAPRARRALDEEDEGPRTTPREELPDPAGWAGRYVQAALEVLAGERPVVQLVRWTSSRVYADVQRRAVRAGAPSGLGGRTPERRRLPGAQRSVVRSVRVSEPADGVAEVSAVVARAGRVHAVALRLEGLGGRWQCTALQVG